MSEGIKLSILSPERRLVEGIHVEELTLPGSEGQIQVLMDHAPMISRLDIGVFRYLTTRKESVSGVIASGFVEVKDNEVVVMADALELKEEVDLERAKKDQASAEEALKTGDLNENEFKKTQLKLQRAIASQEVVTQ